MADFRLGRLKFNWRGPWTASTSYVIDDIVSFKGNSYVCVSNHTSAASEESWAAADLNGSPARWELHTPGIRFMGVWAPNTFYAVNDLVSYGANQYRCITNHTASGSEQTFYSSDLPNWTTYLESTTYKGDWASGTWYKINDIVKYGNTLYVSNNGHLSGISFDVTKFNVYLESVNFEDSWNGATQYQPGDIVTFGGYTYIAETINTGKQPNLYSEDDTNTVPVTPKDWAIVTTGFAVQGDYDNGTVYVPGDVVQFGGNTYVKKTTSAAGVYPTSTTDWDLVSAGLRWRGPWDAANTYQVNDVVSSTSASWVNLTPHNINIDPIADQTISTEISTFTFAGGSTVAGQASQSYTAVAQSSTSGSGANATFTVTRDGNGDIDTVVAVNRGTGYAASDTVTLAAADISDTVDLTITVTAIGTGTGGANWQALAQGESTLTLQNPGDILYRNNSGANVNLPIGSEGQILTVSDQGLPAWERNNTCANVYYVATDGTDDPDWGKNLSKPWRTLRYALSQTANLGTADNIVSIFVKSGKYEEQLPLVTTPYTSIIGDNLRATVIAPDPNTQSTDASPVENRFSTMFFLSESVTLKDLVMSGMEGFTPAAGANNEWDITQATIRGVFLKLHPGDAITGKSPYITQCSAFSGRPDGTAANCNGGVGALIDRSVYNTGVVTNGSMLFDSFTQFHDGGAGFWCKDQGNAEIVSSFTYYCHIGYTCTGGGRIRSLSGNNSWGSYGAVSSGFDSTETPLTGTVRGQRLNFAYAENSSEFQDGEQVVQGEEVSAGVFDYSTSNANYALGLVLAHQDEYLIIESITGDFSTPGGAPIQGQTSNATGTTDATAPLTGITGKVFTLTDLPISGGQAVLPKVTGAVKFEDVSGLSQYSDSNYYIIQAISNESTASKLALDVLRQYDVPGDAPTGIDIATVSRTSGVSTITTSSAHGLSNGDEVRIVVAGLYTSFSTVPADQANAATFATTTVTVSDTTTFTYSQAGESDVSAQSLSTGTLASRVYRVDKTGGTPAGNQTTHSGGSSVTLYNVSSTTSNLDKSSTNILGANEITIPVGVPAFTGQISLSSGTTAAANQYLLINNEIMEISSVSGTDITVVRGAEGTANAEHADGSIVYYLSKTSSATQLQSDVSNVTTSLPVFDITNFDLNDIVKVDNEFFRIATTPAPTLVGRATVTFAVPKLVESLSGQDFNIRLRYSQVRLTGHDFLLVGTGKKVTTNWPGQPTQDADQAKEVYEDRPGRVYYVSTDQDGNFRVGEQFLVEQATGSATLDANAFNLSGLQSLRLGAIGAQLGASINEFSTDVNLGSEFASDQKVGTQKAVKTYVDNAVGGGIQRTAPIQTLAGISISGNTATATTFTISGLYQGDEVIVSGAQASQDGYNGRYTVISVDSTGTVFTYGPVNPAPTGDAVAGTGLTLQYERVQKIDSDELHLEGNLTLNPTWNEGLTGFNAVDINITDTASASLSNVISASVGATEVFKVDKSGNISAEGSLTVKGTTTTIESTSLAISDAEIIVANGATNSATADGAGLGLGSSNIKFRYNHSNTRFNLENASLNLTTGKELQINGATALSETTLGTTVVNSSLTSVGTLTSLGVSGISAIGGINETVANKSAAASGNQTYDFQQSAIWYHPSVSGNVIADVTNVPTTGGKASTVVLLVNQGATPYTIDTSFGINGVAYTVKWSGGAAPSPSASKVDAYAFTMINTGTNAAPAWMVIGSKTDFA
jgi:hypothetical protein